MTFRAYLRIAPLGALLITGCGDIPQIRGVLELDGEAMSLTGVPPYDLGKRELAKGRYGLAVSAFNTALAAEPASVAILNALAATYDRMGRFDLADRYYGRALDLAPDDPQTLNNAGYSRYLRGDLAQAVALLGRASRLDTASPVIAANLATADRARAAATTVVVAGGPPEAPPAPQMLIQRTSPGVHTLALAAPEFLAAARKAGVDPKLAAVQSRRPQPQELTPFPTGERVAMAALERLAAGPDRQDYPKPAARTVTCRLEISNGAGRPRMATRMRGFLRSAGLDVGCLTNAAGFGQDETVIAYRPGFQAAAQALAAKLPIPVTLKATPDQANDVRLLLGRDLLPFDHDLLRRETADEA